MSKSTSVAASCGTSSTSEHLSALNLLQQAFPGCFRLTTKQIAASLSSTPASIRTMRCRGTFPIPSTNDGRYDIRDVAEYLDKQRTPKPRRGAPTKAERLAKLEGGSI